MSGQVLCLFKNSCFSKPNLLNKSETKQKKESPQKTENSFHKTRLLIDVGQK